MSPRTNEVAMMYENMTEQEQFLIFALMRRLMADDIATQEDIAAHKEAMEAWHKGETVPLSNVL